MASLYDLSKPPADPFTFFPQQPPNPTYSAMFAPPSTPPTATQDLSKLTLGTTGLPTSTQTAVVAPKPATFSAASLFTPPTAPPAPTIAPVATSPVAKPAIKPAVPPTPTFNPSQDIAKSQAAADAMKSAGTFPTTPALDTTPPVPGQGNATIEPPVENIVGNDALNKIREKYGLGAPAPTTPAATTTPNNLKDYGFTPEAIDAQLQQEKDAIAKRYEIKRQQATVDAENQKNNALANLYSAGNVDPRSSGVSNVESKVTKDLADRKAAIDAAEAEEVSNATNRALGLKKEGVTMAQTAQKDVEAKIQQEFQNEQTKFQSNLQAITAAINIQNSNRQMSKDDKDNARQAIVDALDFAKAGAFNGYTPEQLASAEKAAGMGAGQLTNILTKMKEEEILGRKSEIQKGADGALYKISTQADGTTKVEKLVGGKVAGTGTGMTSAQINTTVNQIANSFDNEASVKNHNIIQEGYTYASSLANKPNPTSTDDQGLIYAFAKAQDPASAVREGEYMTVQKYSQSLAQQKWANLKRMASNQPFLTDEARKNMVATINSRYQASQKSYAQVRDEYQRQINDAYAGKPRQITNYSIPDQNDAQNLRQQLIDEGYSEQEVNDAITQEFGG